MARNTLIRSQARALEDFLMARRERLASRTLSAGEVAAEASKAIGCDVSEANVKGAMRAIGMSAAFKRRSVGRASRGNVLMVARSLADIMTKLGETIPPDLAAYIASKGPK